MKRRVELSGYCWIVSALIIAFICGILIYDLKLSDNIWPVVILSIVLAGLIVPALFYMPLSISVDDKSVKIRRPLLTKHIPISDMSDVKLCAPTMGARRICGSGGWLGWYGWFSEGDLGKYFAYYGKASDCFLVTLKDGRKYMLGCTDAPAMTAEISSRIS